MPPQRRLQGFTLVETLIALVILGVALLMGMALLLEQPRVLHRLDAEREALRAIEGTLESIRSGTLPPQTAQYNDFAISAGGPAPRELALWVSASPISPTGLYQVTLRARYKVAGRVYTRQVDTLVWNWTASSDRNP